MKALLLFFILNSFFFLEAYPQEKKITFEQLSLKEGLSQNNVLCMLQDRKGYLWFGTYDGLNRYDGYTFKVFNFDYQDTSSLSQNLIISLFEDRRGIIWVGTAGNGLCSFDPAAEKFTRYPVKQNFAGNLQVGTITDVNEDRLNNLWIGTTLGLYQLNPQTGEFTRFNLLPTQPGNIGQNLSINNIFKDASGVLWIGTFGNGLFKISLGRGEIKVRQYQHHHWDEGSIGSKNVVAAFEDHKGELWIGTMEGLDKLDRKTGLFSHYRHEPDDPHSLSSNHINLNAITEDKAGNLWIGTTWGLNKLNRDRTAFRTYFHKPSEPGSISRSDVHSVLVDDTGTLWAGTINGGISRSNLIPKQFTRFSHDPGNLNSLSHNGVRALYEDREGTLWIGTEGGGLNRYDVKTNTFTHFKRDPSNSKGIPSDYVSSILEDRYGNLWIGFGGSNYFVHDGGLSKLDRKTGHFTTYPIHSEESVSLADTEVFTIYEDREGYLWLGTENGIKRLDPKSGNIIHYLHSSKNPSGISDSWCYAIFEDSRNNLWIGTGSNALNKLDRKTGKFTHYSYNPPDPTSISSHSVRQILEDKVGRLWFATSGGGLCLFEPLTESFTAFTKKEGLSSTVHRIEEDEEGKLWLSTNKGICRFDPVSKKVITFDYSDGLQGNQFASGYVNAGASCRGKDGALYFGGSEGFNSFHPKDIRLNTNIPPIVITQFRLFDQPIPGVNEASEFTFNYDQNVFSVEFAALNYTNSHKNQYAYKLENFDKGWTYSGTRHYASYTNLDPGNYIFRVKGSNNDGIWNEEGTSLKIIILPPWWQTWWAYSLYGVLGISFMYGLFYYTRSRERLKSDLQLQRLEAEKMHEVDQLKSRFFANISHEFRTPLTLILGPIEELLEKNESRQEHAIYKLIQRNAQRLLKLINQLLDLSKLEVGSLKVEARQGDVMEFLRGLVSSFTSLALSRKIDFTIVIPSLPLITLFDADKLEKIVTNLLSNAFKFTPEGGAVRVAVSIQKAAKESAAEQLMLEVVDTGIGIPEDQQEKIFDRFYQIDSTHTLLREGTGIGLALTRELVELHGGTIRVSSMIGKGSCFTVYLPITITIEEQPVPIPSSNEREIIEALSPAEEDSQEKEPEQNGCEQNSLPLLLVVEDNRDVRRYISGQLQDEYQLIEAVDGKEGLQKAFEAVPDLIISDVMMPQMDGFELCDQLKNDERTSHVPIILLTAKASESSKMEGLQMGADDYLTKPFRAVELRVRVKNLIEQRKKLRKSFSREIFLQPKAISISSMDERFLEKVIAVIEQHMADPEFNVESFGREVGLSRAQLYRKLHALTDQSPSEFIKTIRIKRAASLLLQQYGSIGEVAYAVGFNDPSYFTKCFREVYKQSPSDYITSQLSKV